MRALKTFAYVFITSACTVALSAALADSTTHYVSTNGLHAPPFTSWDTAATNIQAAVDQASPGDTVLVSNGVYDTGTRVSTFTVLTRVVVTNSVTVRSVNGAPWTEIRGAAASGGGTGTDAVRCAYLTAGSHLVGFTLRSGHTASATFGGNVAPRHGGGAFLDHGGSIENCTVRDCKALGKGGGVICHYGGTVLDTRVCFNHATSQGGGISCNRGGSVTRCQIYANSVNVDGGGIHFSFGGQGVFHSTIWSNQTLYADGGGIAVYSSSPAIRNCLLYGNSANAFGRGGGIWSNNGALQASGCTLWGNTAADSGGGIHVMAGSRAPQFRNCIIYSNTAASGPNYHDAHGSTEFSHCSTYPAPSSGTGNMTNNPSLHAPEDADFHLTATSPCIDMGSVEAWMPIALDFDGDPRVYNATNDIGVDEASLRCVSITYDTSGVHTAWSVVPDAELRLQTCTNLLSEGWQETSCTGIASGVVLQCVDSNMVGRFMAYRLLWIRD